MRSFLSSLAGMALMAMSASPAGASTVRPAVAMKLGASTSPGIWHYARPGHSVRQGQRAARKARQVALNRRHHRRAGR